MRGLSINSKPIIICYFLLMINNGQKLNKVCLKVNEPNDSEKNQGQNS